MPEIKRSSDELYNVYMGMGGKKLLHREPWSNPDAETYLTGINYYERPRSCRQRLRELYPMVVEGWEIPESDAPIPRPKLGGAVPSNDEHHTVRWGDSETGTFLHGAYFKTPEDVFNFSPLEHADFSQ